MENEIRPEAWHTMVFHLSELKDIYKRGWETAYVEVYKTFPRGFTFAAYVDTDSLDEAFRVTQDWEGGRSSMPGDLFLPPWSMTLWLCCDVGWRKTGMVSRYLPGVRTDPDPFFPTPELEAIALELGPGRFVPRGS